MLITLFILLIVLLDQATKYLAATYIQGQGDIHFLDGVLHFTYHENEGAAWGILADNRWIFMTISVIAILVLTAYLFYSKKNRDPLLSISLPMFIGGGIGNMIDRVRLGYVVDFFEFEFIDFPVFNIADSFISIGCCILIFYLARDLIHEIKHSRETKNQP